MGDDIIDEFLSALLVMWDEGKFGAVVLALAGHDQSTIARFTRDLDDFDRGSKPNGVTTRHVNTFIRLLQERGR